MQKQAKLDAAAAREKQRVEVTSTPVRIKHRDLTQPWRPMLAESTTCGNRKESLCVMKLLEAVADSQSQVAALARQERPKTAPSRRQRPGTAGKPGTAGAGYDGGIAAEPRLLDTSMRRGTYFGFSTGKAEMLHKRNGPADGGIFSKTAGEVEAAGFGAQLDDAADSPETTTTPTRPGVTNTSHRRGTYFGSTHAAAGERTHRGQARKTKMAAELASREGRGRADGASTAKRGGSMLPDIDGDSLTSPDGDGVDVPGAGAGAGAERSSGGKAGKSRETFFGFDDGKALSRKTKRARARRERMARRNKKANADKIEEEVLQRSPAAMVSAQSMGKRGSFFGLLRGVSDIGADDEEIDETTRAVGAPPTTTGSMPGTSIVGAAKHMRRLSGSEMFEQGLLADIMAEAGMPGAGAGAGADGTGPPGAPMVKFAPESDEQLQDAPWTGDEGLEEAKPSADEGEVSLDGSQHLGHAADGDEDHSIDMGANVGSLEWKLWQMALAAPKISEEEALQAFDDLDSEGHAGKQEGFIDCWRIRNSVMMRVNAFKMRGQKLTLHPIIAAFWWTVIIEVRWS